MSPTAITTEYDKWFEQYMVQWLPEWPWQWEKAQAYAESLLQPNAVSPVGAKGLMQFMPETWQDVAFRLRFPSSASPFDPQYAIEAGAYYMGVMRGGWGAKRSEEDRRNLAFASYNAGFGHLLEAQKLSGGKNDYASIIAELPKVTDVENAKQTSTYVQRINHYFTQFTEGTTNAIN